MTPEQRIAADLGLTVADMERIVRDERAKRKAAKLADCLDTALAFIRYDGKQDAASMPRWGGFFTEAQALLAEIDRPINT